MVHANFYVTKTHPSQPIVFLPAADRAMVNEVVEQILSALPAEQKAGVNAGLQRLVDNPESLRTLGQQADFLMVHSTSNQDLGLLLKSVFTESAQMPLGRQYGGTGAQWLRLIKYAVSLSDENHGIASDLGDHDASLTASICGIPDGLPFPIEHIVSQVTTVNLEATLKYDMRRNVENVEGNEHYVEHDGILDIQTLQGARFVESANYDSAVACASPTYVFDPVVTLRMLQYEGEYYPDLRSSAVVGGIRKVGALGEPLEEVYMGDLYGRIDHTNTITLRQNENTGVTTYWVRGTAGDDLSGNPRNLHYHGLTPHSAVRREDTFIYEDFEKTILPRRPDTANMSQADRDTIRTYYSSYDGTKDSVYQMGARFGTADAHNSILGCVLPIQITKGGNNLLAKCAPVDIGRGNMLRVRVHNPQAVLPTHDMIASSLARRGRRNEVGIALQLLTPSKQGDIVLYDGV